MSAVPLAEIEGELRDLVRDMRGSGASFDALPTLDAAERLEQIIARYSGVRPLHKSERELVMGRLAKQVCPRCARLISNKSRKTPNMREHRCPHGEWCERLPNGWIGCVRCSPSVAPESHSAGGES